MAVIKYMYPNGTHLCDFIFNQGWGQHLGPNDWNDDVTTNTDCVPYCSDLVGALDEKYYAVARSRGQEGNINRGQFEWYATAPPQACTIQKVQIWAYVRMSYGNAQTIASDPTLVGFVSDGATRYYDSSAKTVTAFTFRNRVDAIDEFEKLDFGLWDTCPWTTSAWTQADLAENTFKFGLASDGTHGSGIDVTIGGSHASLDVAQVYLELTTVPLDTAEPVRNVVTQQLRLFRKPLRIMSISLPPQFGEVNPGEYVWTSHPVLPVTSDGDMWVEPWKHVPLYVLSVRDELDPPGVTLDCLDLRQVFVNWWSPLRTTIGVTDDYRGIAKLDRGGGWKIFRDQVTYVQRPGDYRFQQVASDRAAIGKDGLIVQGGDDINQIRNSTFSLGSTALTYWTTSQTGGATVAGTTGEFLVDVSGYRRCVSIGTVSTSGDDAYISQTTPELAADTKFHVHAWTKKKGGDDDLSIQVVRETDVYYWNDYEKAWQASAYTIHPATTTDWSEWMSKGIDLGATPSTVTVKIGLMAADQTQANSAYVGAVDLLTGANMFASTRTLLPTQHSAVTRATTYVKLNNDSEYRIWNPAGPGWCKFTFTPNWSHDDLADAEEKYLVLSNYGSGTPASHAAVYYGRIDATIGRWGFYVYNPPNQWDSYLDVITDDMRAKRGQAMRIAVRWTSVAQDEFGRTGQALDIFVNGQDPTIADNAAVPETPYGESTICVVLGGVHENEELLENGQYSADGTFTDFEIGSHPRTAIELKSRTGTITTFTVLEEVQDVKVGGTATASAVPMVYSITVVTSDVHASGTATAEPVPRTRTATVITEDAVMAGTGSCSFVSA